MKFILHFRNNSTESVEWIQINKEGDESDFNFVYESRTKLTFWEMIF